MADDRMYYQDADMQLHEAHRVEIEVAVVATDIVSGGTLGRGQSSGSGRIERGVRESIGLNQEFIALGRNTSRGSQSHSRGLRVPRGGSRGSMGGSTGGGRSRGSPSLTGGRNPGVCSSGGSSGEPQQGAPSMRHVSHGVVPTSSDSLVPSEPSVVASHGRGKRPAVLEDSGPSKKRARTPHQDVMSKPFKAKVVATISEFFKTRGLSRLEKRFLGNGAVGLEALEARLVSIIDDIAKEEAFSEDKARFSYQTWPATFAKAVIFNPVQTLWNVQYRQQVLDGRTSPTSEGFKADLERFKAGVDKVKPKGRSGSSIPWVQQDLAARVATRGREGVVWLPLEAEIKALDRRNYEGGFGIVRRVSIEGVSCIPPNMDFAGKTMKEDSRAKNREKRSIEALACPVDHPGVIKIQYLDRRTYESYTLWWNGGSLASVWRIDSKYEEEHEDEILRTAGIDLDARLELCVYRKNRAYLAWALMCIMDVIHSQRLLHNDLSPNNVMLHFPKDKTDAVYIGVCDWGMASWDGEDKMSNYGRPSRAELDVYKGKYHHAAPELFHVYGKHGTPTSPKRMGIKHKHNHRSEAYAVGYLARKIYNRDCSSSLFQKNKDPSSLSKRFEQCMDELLKPDPLERSTVTHVVDVLKKPPYNLDTPWDFFRNE